MLALTPIRVWTSTRQGLPRGGHGSSHFVLELNPIAQKDPTEQGQNGRLYSPFLKHSPQGSPRICPFPSRRNNKNELVIFLNGHIFWLTQTLLELVLVKLQQEEEQKCSYSPRWNSKVHFEQKNLFEWFLPP